MNYRIIYTIFAKELLEALRDKRTLMAMIGVPVILYPAMIILVSQAAVMQKARMEEAESTAAVAAETPAVVREWVRRIPKVRVVASAHPAEDLRRAKVDVVITADPKQVSALGAGGTFPVRIAYDAAEIRSQVALRRVRDGLAKERQTILDERLRRAGHPPEFIDPVKVEEENVAPPAKTTASLTGSVLPLLMILMLGIGAFYPAVDLTAGEKERGTFETLLSTPASKKEIVGGKFLAVLCLSLITGLLNLGSMTLSLTFQLAQLARSSGSLELGVLHLSPGGIAVILLVMIPLAFFICAAMMALAVVARSFKEAQNFITPFFILILLPGAWAAAPGMELSRATQFVPIANVALLFKSLLMQKGTVEGVFAVFLSTGVYAALALAAAIGLFQREEVILSEEKGVPLTLRRSAFPPRRLPTPGMALLLFAVALLSLFYPGTYAQSRWSLPGILLTEWLLILLPPVLILWYLRVELRASFNWRWPGAGPMAAGVLMGVGMLVLGIQLIVWQNTVLPMPNWLVEEMARVFHFDGSTGQLVLLLAAVAVSPAVCEELLFRGPILSGLRTRLSPVTTILIVGLLFGLIHVNIYRLMPTTFLGVGITYLALRSGSVFPGMLFHFLVNATAMLAEVKRLPAPLQSYIESNQVDQNGFPAWLLLAALGATALGVAILEVTRTRENSAESPGPGQA